MTLLLAALNVAIVVLAGACALPQTVRLLRTGATAGVSGVAVVLAVVFDVAWILYTIGRGRVGPATADVVYLLSAALLAAAAARAGLIRGAALRAGAYAAAALAVVAVVGQIAGDGWVPLGIVLAAQQLVVGTPTILTVWRSESLDGLAPSGYWLALLSAAVGGAYAVIVGDGPLQLWAVLTVLANLPVLLRYRWVRTRVAAEAEPVPAPATAGV